MSGLVRSARITSALSLVDDVLHNEDPRRHRTAPNIYEIIPRWETEVALLDQLRGQSKLFPNGVIAAFLLTMRRHGEIKFWEIYRDEAGNKAGRTLDAVEALRQHVLSERVKSGGREAQVDLAEKAVSAYKGFQGNRNYAGGLHPTNLIAYINGINRREKTKKLILPGKRVVEKASTKTISKVEEPRLKRVAGPAKKVKKVKKQSG
jgi:hypothetical protein